jgi:hypothetical protein
MICERCGCVFCWDEADEHALIGQRKRFCSQTCRERAGHVRRTEEREARKAGLPRAIAEPACPTPAKRGFASKHDALAKATKVARAFRYVPVRTYRCPCGSWHLTSQRLSRA